MEKFALYLKDQNVKFLRKAQIRTHFENFCQLWNSSLTFDSVMASLRKTTVTYLFDDYWAVSKENPLVLFQEFLTFLGVSLYYGLTCALYIQGRVWQPPLRYTLLNTKYTKTRTIKGLTIQCLKILKELYNAQTLIQTELLVSDYEKTILDMLYFTEQKFYEPENFEKVNLYLSLFANYPEVRANLIERLGFEKKGLIK